MSSGQAKLNIAYITGTFPNISETFVINQIVGLAKRGHRVDIFTINPKRADRAPDEVRLHGLLDRTQQLYCPQGNIARICRVLSLVLRYGWRIRGVLPKSINIARYGRHAISLNLMHGALMFASKKPLEYDIVHCQFGPYGVMAQRFAEIGAVNAKLVTSFRGYDVKKYLKANPNAYEKLFSAGDLFLPVSQSLANRLVQAGCNPSKVLVHHSGIDLEKLRFMDRPRSGSASTRMISIARLVEKKGIVYAIDAVARLIRAGFNVSYTVIGDGPLRAELENQISKLGVNAHVHLVGWITHDKVIGLLENAQLMVAPSVSTTDGDEEGIPNALKEAMAVGLPVVGTHHGGIPELVEDGISGYLVPQRNARELADRLAWLIEHPETWGEIAKAAREKVKREFDIERLNDELESLYRALIVNDRMVSGRPRAN